MTSITHYAPLPTRAQRSRLAASLGGSVEFVRRIEGGLGCTMDVLSVRGPAENKKVVLRRYGPWGKPGKDHPAPVEAHALELASRHGVPVPDVVWVDHDSLFAEPTIVISYIDGEPLTLPDDPISWADQLAKAAAAIHSVPLNQTDHDVIEHLTPGGNDDGVTVPDELVRHRLGPELWKVVLERRESLLPETDCFLHADFWPGNTLWREGRLIAVVDWEHPGIGDPALDIAYAAMDMRCVGHDQAADRFIATYKAASGRDLPNLGYWTAISLCRPMPDIGRWHPSYVAFGHQITVEQLRARHEGLIRLELAS